MRAYVGNDTANLSDSLVSARLARFHERTWPSRVGTDPNPVMREGADQHPPVLPVGNHRPERPGRRDQLERPRRFVAAEKGPGDERAGAVGGRCSEIGSSRSQRRSAAFILRVGLCWRGGEAVRG